jgi:hypothetical protein
MNKPNSRRQNSAIILIMVVLVAGLYLLARHTSFDSIIPKINGQHKGLSDQDFQDASFEGNGKWYGLCNKNSIHSVADFRKTVSSDRVLQAHYADFRWENAKMGRLEKATWAYVYYRKNDTIFRKKTPIVLASGDEYITDGNVRVRTTCCNSYNAGPSVADLDADPAAGAPPLNDKIPLASSEPIQDPFPAMMGGPVALDPNVYGGVPLAIMALGPALISSGGNDSGGGTPSTDPIDPNDPPGPGGNPVPIPEPSTIFLLGIGVVYFLILFFIYKKASLRKG